MKKLKDINWNHLYCFYEVARKQSIKESSKVLGLAVSTISEHLKKLETNLGINLFERTSKGLHLTKEGEGLYAYSKDIFETGRRLIDSLSSNSIGGYPVKVGIEEMVGNEVATQFVAEYWDMFITYGTVNTVRETTHDKLVEDVLHGLIDWGISQQRPNRKRLDSRKFSSVQISFYCAEELLQKLKSPEEVLRKVPLAKSTWDSHLNRTIDEHLRAHEIYPEEYVESDHFEYLRNLCAKGRCVMFLAEGAEKTVPELTKFQLNGPVSLDLYAIWRKSNVRMVAIQKLQDLIDAKTGTKLERPLDEGLGEEGTEGIPYQSENAPLGDAGTSQDMMTD